MYQTGLWSLRTILCIYFFKLIFGAVHDDNYVYISGLHHTAGVVLRKDVVAKADADVIRRLREKGAIIIGLTNVPEICMWYVRNIIFCPFSR